MRHIPYSLSPSLCCTQRKSVSRRLTRPESVPCNEAPSARIRSAQSHATAQSSHLREDPSSPPVAQALMGSRATTPHTDLAQGRDPQILPAGVRKAIRLPAFHPGPKNLGVHRSSSAVFQGRYLTSVHRFHDQLRVWLL